uniref:Major facilitator family protein n=1 Tax=uncultured bacterium Contig19 TaxID=1393523 RepID=W0FMF2_9BACT|nr:major facilitator family protein [uncultured bacterium Contig19]
MRITGAKRWFVVALCALMAGVMVYVPFLRYSYYNQMVILFTEFHQVVDASEVNSFIGLFGMAFGIVSMFGYPFGGIFADKFSEKWLLIIGGVLMGVCSFWFGIVPGKVEIIIIHLLYGVGTSFLIWSAYLKLTRKMGNAQEQGRMFSTSEFVRGIFGTVIGFVGVGLLGTAVLGDGSLDPEALGAAWRNLLWVSGALFFVFAALVFFFVPKDVKGAEEADDAVQEPFSMRNVLTVLKLPGTWMIAALIFCCFSFTSAGNGYLGAYTVDVLGVDETTASTYAIIRNYIIAAVMTFAIGFISDKIGSKSKTLGIYLVIATVLCAVLIVTKSMFVLCLAISFAFAIVYSGMRGIYFATLSEVGIPLAMTGIATGIISMLCYLPDVYFAALAGSWLDSFGLAGYDYIWIYTVACGIAGIIVAFITYRYSKKLEARNQGTDE